MKRSLRKHHSRGWALLDRDLVHVHHPASSYYHYSDPTTVRLLHYSLHAPSLLLLLLLRVLLLMVLLLMVFVCVEVVEG